MQLQIGHGVPWVVIGLFAALFRRSLAAAMHRRQFSKFLVALMVVARHPDLLLVAVSSFFGSMPADLRFCFKVILVSLFVAPRIAFSFS